MIRKYDASGTLLFSKSGIHETNALTTAASNHLFAVDNQSRANGGSFRIVAEYDASGTLLHRFRYTSAGTTGNQTITGLASHVTGTGDLLAAQEGNGVKYFSIPPLGPIAVALSIEAASVGNTKAMLKAELNPEGKATSYHFEYVDDVSFQSEGGFASANTKSTPSASTGAADFELHLAQAVVGCQDPIAEIGTGKCLTPNTTYHYRVVATNADNPTGTGEAATASTFKTRPPLEILATFATNVASESARLNAVANPLGIPTTGYFEYLDDATFQQTDSFIGATKVPIGGDLEFGSGEGGVTRSFTLAELAPATTYHYRLVATDPLIDPVEGPGRTFTTFSSAQASESCSVNEVFRSGPSATLPDCRAYEMVSPLAKENGDVVPLVASAGVPAALDLSSSSGGKLLYGTYRAFGDAVSGAYTSQYVAARGPEGWVSHAITPPRQRLNLEGLNMLDTEVKSVTPDLCQAFLRTVAEPVLAPGAVPAYPNLYHRADGECGTEAYEALTTVKPPDADKQDYSQAQELQGTSADGSTAIFVVNDNLTTGLIPGTPAPVAQPQECLDTGKGCKLRLYRKSAAGLSYLCVLPGEALYEGACSAGAGLKGSSGGEDRQANLEGAISDDGSRVFWTAAESGAGKIYVRIGDTETIAVSKTAEEESGTSKSQFWAASQDGSKAIFTTGEDLYEFDVDAKTTTPLAEGVSGVLGASTDSSYVYFASKDDLSGPNAEGHSPEVGEANLYLAHAGVTRFILTLVGQEGQASEHGKPSPISVAPFSRLARVTPSGLDATFMSAARPPSGYDNTDAVSGEVDAEVFLYDAGAQKLHCVSCNPTGARPVGTLMKNPAGTIWVAAQIPAWQNALHAARPISDDGSRLYFQTTDALALGDTNGVGDVYQWERPGSGGCEESDPSFAPAPGGCIELISSGQSARASEFIDSSPSGDDVFFATLASLVEQDYGLVDIYDARVGGGLPAPPLPPVQCEGETCQNPAPAPEDPVPSSALYVGPGNAVEAPVKPVKCGKGKHKVKKNGKSRCVKNKGKQNKSKKGGRAR